MVGNNNLIALAILDTLEQMNILSRLVAFPNYRKRWICYS